MGLVEEVYTDRQNADSLQSLKSALNAPHVISVAILREPDVVVLDVDSVEI